MSRSFYSRVGLVAGIVASVGTALTLTTTARPVSAEPVQPQAGSAAAQPSSLRVTGTAQQFTIEADHADVQKALKSLFDQANKQFDVDSKVAGQVTLRLTDQTFETVLTSVCKQTFLRYHRDAGTGIYHFESDDDAIKESFTHLGSLNADLRQQLRALGLDLPDDTQLNRPPTSQNRAQNEVTGRTPIGQGRGGGGQPGSPAFALKDQQPAPGTSGVRGGNALPPAGDAGPSGPAGPDAKQLQKPDNAKSTKGYIEKPISVPSNVPLDLLMDLLGNSNMQIVGQEKLPVIQESYLQFLRQNNLVAFYSNGIQYPMTDVLYELGRQANVQVLIDPSVPRGKQFRINLNLPPHPLEEALNMILPGARLRWRRVANTVYITPTADFQIFYGSAPQPYVIYGNSSNNQSQQRGQQNNTQQPPGP